MATEPTLAKLWAAIQSNRGDPTRHIGEHIQDVFKLRHRFIQEAYEVLEAHQARLTRLETNVNGAPEPEKGFGVKHHVAAEAVDVLVYLHILLASIDVTPDDVYEVMENRYSKYFARLAAE